jgi:hypothetical protein
MRKGSLSDRETLRHYENGVSIIALCIHEAMTPYGIISRLGRARRERRGSRLPSSKRRIVVVRRRTPQPTYDSFEALRAAVAELSAAAAKLSDAA